MKINNSDYSNWARRKSTEYLTKLLSEHLRTSFLRSVIGVPPFAKPPKYFERKLRAADRELSHRNV